VTDGAVTVPPLPGGDLSPEEHATTGRGELRIYLGAAPGVGKTYAMLNEGRRRRDRGTDVVVGFVETYGRQNTAAELRGLEVIPRKRMNDRPTEFEEMDVDAVLARGPEVALVDELAHTNIPGSRNEKRWQDVEELLEAGITVISTVNIGHLESLNDVVERITGIRQQETIPDAVVRRAEQVELVDMTPEALRRRLAHGNVYAPEKIDAALANYFRPGNLGALRELALLWVADQVDVALEQYRARHGITEPWETRERVVVAMTGAPGTDALIRRAARIAGRAHGELLGVHVTGEERLLDQASPALEEHRRLLEEMGGQFHAVAGGDIAAALVDFARAENATQLVLGSTRQSRWGELTRGSVINRVVRLSGTIDVHVISEQSRSERAGPSPAHRRRRLSPLPPRRRALGWLAAVAGVSLLTLLLANLRNTVALPTVLVLFLALVVTTAAIGGSRPAFLAAVGGFLAANWFFTPPFHRLQVAEAEHALALAVFLGVAALVSHFVDTAAHRSLEAGRARAEAQTLATLAATTSEDDPLPSLLGHLRNAFGLETAAILAGRDGHWSVEATSGEGAPTRPEDATFVEPLPPDGVLAVVGKGLAADDRPLLKVFAVELASARERRRLRAEANRAHQLADANELRSALLQAVSHDLRTPLASIKASVSSLCQDDVDWTAEERREFLGTIAEETDRLISIITNLLDMSRIQAGALQPVLQPIGMEEVVPAAVASLGRRADVVDVDIDETLPPVRGDAALLERAVANVIGNAVSFTPAGQRVRVEAGAFADRLDLRVVDRGAGIPRPDRERVFQPFQRLGDRHRDGGVGLGLAVTRGFVNAMGGTVEIDDTPGGGTTVVITLPVAR
jgi:two-component system, OmpR family, sensor histidine kinase KdpD